MHLCSELPQYRVGAMLCNGKYCIVLYHLSIIFVHAFFKPKVFQNGDLRSNVFFRPSLQMKSDTTFCSISRSIVVVFFSDAEIFTQINLITILVVAFLLLLFAPSSETNYIIILLISCH